MNLLSMLSIMLATSFLIGGVYCLTRNRKSELNIFSFLVLILLGWWSFCNACFFSADTEAEAWKWHHLASLGWTGFIAETTYYFLALTGIRRRMKKLWIQIVYYFFPVVLLLHNLFGRGTSLATGLVRSKLGGQWAYVNTWNNIWLWLYLACLFLYFGLSFLFLLRWAFRVKHRLKRRMAVGFVVLDALTILFGFVTDVLSPLTNQSIPAIANLSTAIFGIGYFFIILQYDIFNIRHVVEERDVIEHSMEALMVVDESSEILDFNLACLTLFDVTRDALMGKSIDCFFAPGIYQNYIHIPLQSQDFINGVELPFCGAQSKKQLMISGSVIRDKQKEYLGTVLSLRDITQLNQLKEEYRAQSEKYQRLAFLDTLTGLPNRRKTFEVLNEYAVRYQNAGVDFFILYMDLDHFKSVNDQFGHHIGDLFLKMVSQRLKRCVQGDLQFLGRLSGDEFLMIGCPRAGKEDAAALIQLIQEAFAAEFVFQEIRVKSGVSIGYASYSEFEDVDAMVHYADEAMYQMKQKRK